MSVCAASDSDQLCAMLPCLCLCVHVRRACPCALQVTLTKRWHKDVDKWYKRLWLTCKGSHTLLAGLLYRGSVGFSRAQTVMILSNRQVSM